MFCKVWSVAGHGLLAAFIVAMVTVIALNVSMWIRHKLDTDTYRVLIKKMLFIISFLSISVYRDLLTFGRIQMMVVYAFSMNR